MPEGGDKPPCGGHAPPGPPGLRRGASPSVDLPQSAGQSARQSAGGLATGQLLISRHSKVQGNPMDYRSIFTDAIAALHAERRYRVFADIERIAGPIPHRPLAQRGGRARDRGVVLQRLPRHGAERRRDRGAWPRRRAPWARAPAARATSPGTTTRSFSSRPSSPTCMARKRRWCSPRASFRTKRRSRRSRSCCPTASSSPTS